MRFKRAHERLIAEREIDLLSHGLRHIPGQVEIDLESIALRVAPIHGHRIAVSNGNQVARAGRDQTLMRSLQRGQGVATKRDLVDGIESGFSGPAGGQHQLMMLIGVAAEKHQIERTIQTSELTAISHGELKHLRVKRFHATDVGHEHTEMRKGKTGPAHADHSSRRITRLPLPRV